MVSAGLGVWLHRLEPLLLLVAVGSLGYAHWMLWSRRRQGRPLPRMAGATVWFSTIVNVVLFAVWFSHRLGNR